MAYIADPIDKNDTLYIIPYCEGNRSVTGITNTYKSVYTIFYKLFLHIRELAVICNQLPKQLSLPSYFQTIVYLI